MTAVFMQPLVESRDHTAALTEIENFLSPSSSKTIVSRATSKTEAVNSAKNSHLFFMGIWKVLSEEKEYRQDSVHLTGTFTLLIQKL